MEQLRKADQLTDEQISALRVVANLMDELEIRHPSAVFYESCCNDYLSLKEAASALRELSGLPPVKREIADSVVHSPEARREITNAAMKVLMEGLTLARDVDLNRFRLEGDLDAAQPRIGQALHLSQSPRFIGKQ